MKILNEDFKFEQLASEVRMQVLGAFSGQPQRKLFVPGAKLYRFITPRKGATRELAGNGVLDAQWWFDSDTRLQLSKLAHISKTSLGNAARSGLAVPARFNREMEYLCSIRLTAPVFGWIGKTRSQEDPDLKITYPGGRPQVYFPSLATAANGMSSAVARLEMWAYLDDAA